MITQSNRIIRDMRGNLQDKEDIYCDPEEFYK